jgi:hypothetical protein
VILWTVEAKAAAQRLLTRLGFRRTMIEMTRASAAAPQCRAFRLQWLTRERKECQ